ncbi:MAG: hypothetical protein K9J13_00970 [Saprospiraceae bacterium]|nr:hypothetical protein [Saprospiraceae bacterium]
MKYLSSILLIILYFISINLYPQEFKDESLKETFEYLYFKASWADKLQSKIEVRWATTKEENCAVYEVQKSSDNTNWETISKTEGQGTVDLLTMYFSMDNSPVFYPAVNFYRLKQIDTKGNSRFSQCVEVFSFPKNDNSVVVSTGK